MKPLEQMTVGELLSGNEIEGSTWLDRTEKAAIELARRNKLLVEALEAAKDWMYNPFEPDNQCRQYNKAKAALAAAKGE